MPTINKEITINVPLETVFDFLAQPSNLPDVWPSLVSIENEQQLPEGGYCFDWEYRMGGFFLTGSGKHTDIALDCWIVCETKSAIDSTITFTLRRIENTTRLFLTIQYGFPLPILSWLGEKTLEKMNMDEVDIFMTNIKEKLEGENHAVRDINSIQLLKC